MQRAERTPAMLLIQTHTHTCRLSPSPRARRILRLFNFDLGQGVLQAPVEALQLHEATELLDGTSPEREGEGSTITGFE